MVHTITAWISIVIAWSTSNTAGAVRVFPNTSPLWYRTESTLNFTCEADDLTKLNWFKNNVKMNIDYLNGFMMTTRQYSQPPSTISNLWKANVGIGDSGVYSCHDVRQRHLEEQIDVRVLNVVGSDVIKQVGHSATLRCNPQNLKHEDFKRIEWRRDYGSMPVHQLPRVSQNDNSFALHLTSLDESDAGHYECIFTFETRTPDGVRQEVSLSKRIRLDVLGYSDSEEEDGRWTYTYIALHTPFITMSGDCHNPFVNKTTWISSEDKCRKTKILLSYKWLVLISSFGA